MFIIDDFVIWLAEKIKEQAEDRLYNVTALKESLQELQGRLDAGGISQKEYDVLEVKLLKAIEEANRYHQARRETGLEEPRTSLNE